MITEPKNTSVRRDGRDGRGAVSPDFQVGLGGVGVGILNVVERERAQQHYYQQHA